MSPRIVHYTTTTISMVSLKWGDVLSTLLPGAVALVAIAPFFPLLHEQILNPSGLGLGAGVALLMASALAGGVSSKRSTRVTWERWWLTRRCPLRDGALGKLKTPHDLALYERGVQGSYKYVTFYANFAWASALLLVSRLTQGVSILAISTWVLALSVAILLYASHVQWIYYVNYRHTIWGDDDAQERTATGNED